MRLLRRWFGREPADKPAAPPPVEVRPLSPIATIDGKPEEIASLMSSEEFGRAVRYFSDYPARSFMSDYSRAVLYSLVRMMRPGLIAEIGTLHAGTTEVFARALHENGAGVIHTADPYGGERCPAIIAQWPAELQKHVQFHAKSSMDFFARALLESKTFDIVLVDGNHDYEFALFDLQMAARTIRPKGVVVMDNAEQAGPFKAARQFLRENPAWREIGDSIARYDPMLPFERDRASLPETTFVLLQAPGYLSIGEGPHSWGQRWIDTPRLEGLASTVVAAAGGTLFYHVYLRGFANGNRWVEEVRHSGRIRIDSPAGGKAVEHRFDQPMSVTAPAEFDDALYTLELDLSWQADPGTGQLALEALPQPLLAT